jgi:hypothetical protein
VGVVDVGPEDLEGHGGLEPTRGAHARFVDLPEAACAQAASEMEVALRRGGHGGV